MRYWLPVLVGFAAACSSKTAGSGDGSSASALVTAPTITFAANWTQSVSAPLVSGRQVQIAYDTRRLSACRATGAQGPEWSITGWFSINHLPATPFGVAGLVPPGSPNPPIVSLRIAGELQMWFENTDASGCHAWDSAYGANYRFAVAPPPDAPSWVGEATSVLDRDSCGGNPCSSGVVHPLDRGFTYDTLARQQDGFTKAFFQVWKAGTTDFDNPNLWKELDVELHARIGDQGAFTVSYIDFYQRLGNNAQYAVDLRALDPLADPEGKITNKDDCPTFPTTLSADGQYIQADFQFYMTVNGVGVQPAGGGVFHGLYQNYEGLYAICESP